ncbi:hypothetical protein DV738_g98, partial [Chaetothyriales sp. CBS 135597]
MASIKVGDTVTVPGDMYGLVKFVGHVAGKQGTFAGVQLASEFVARGKNSGDVDGRFYFRTTVPGSGIFLPVEKAIKRASASGGGARHAPATPARLTAFNQGGRTSMSTATKPSFSQSLGPSALRSGAASPSLKANLPRRESVARPISPMRKATTGSVVASTPSAVGAARAKPRLAATGLNTPKTRPSLAKSTIGTPGLYKTSTTRPPPSAKFSQSLRLTPSAAAAVRSESPMLGPESSFDEAADDEPYADADHIPTPTPTPLGALTRRRDSAVARENRQHEAEKQRLQKMLEEKDRALQEQGLSISEMEKNLIELQKLMPGLGDGGLSGSARSSMPTESDAAEEDLPRDVVSLRAVLREKNEKIRLLTAEFDANRADFRSTIDTLEMASNETERVYEKRVGELLDEVRLLQERTEDVDLVAQQLRQLEELVQELEEGLEDARRGEAEARAEVEFLRGEVERSRSELRRERERSKTEERLNGYGGGGTGSVDGERLDELQAELDSKEDEIRGLKAIIHNLNNTANGSVSPDPKAAKLNGFHHKQASTNEGVHESTAALQKQVQELESLLQLKSAKEEELELEVNQLRNSVNLAKFPMPGASFGLRTGPASPHARHNSDDLRRNALKHVSSGTQGSQSTVVLSPTSERKQFHDGSPIKSARAGSSAATPVIDAISDAGKSESQSTSSAAVWCEICEDSSHDILSCGNMISSSPSAVSPSKAQKPISHSPHPSVDRPAPLISRKSNNSLNSNPSQPPTQALPVLPPGHSPKPKASVPATLTTGEIDGRMTDEERTVPIEGTGDQAGMWAGKSSGVINPDKWCALCERDGHDSVDCPIEDAF